MTYEFVMMFDTKRAGLKTVRVQSVDGWALFASGSEAVYGHGETYDDAAWNAMVNLRCALERSNLGAPRDVADGWRDYLGIGIV